MLGVDSLAGEQPALLVTVLSWRLGNVSKHTQGKWKHLTSHVITLRDISNAFPSIARGELRLAATKSIVAEGDHQLLGQRITDSYGSLPTGHGGSNLRRKPAEPIHCHEGSLVGCVRRCTVHHIGCWRSYWLLSW